MNVNILKSFVAKYGNKDIDKKFNTLKEYKKVYMLEPSTKQSFDTKWLYN